MGESWLVCARAAQAKTLREQLVRQTQALGKEVPQIHSTQDLDSVFQYAAECKVVIIVDEDLGTSALNLVAALRLMSSSVRIVLVHKGLSDSFAYRAKLAGVHELVEGLHCEHYDFIRSRMQKQSESEKLQESSRTARQLCLTSIQGSVGLSSLSFLLAAQAAHCGVSTAFLQFTEQFLADPWVSSRQFIDHSRSYPLDSFERIDRLSDAEIRRRSLRFGEKLYCYAGTSVLQRYEKTQEYGLYLHNRIIRQFDLILTELPSLWGELHPQLISQADRLLIVVEERPQVELRLKSALSFLEACAIPRTRIQLVVNKSKRKRRDRSFVDRLRLSVGAFPLVSFTEAHAEIEPYIEEGSLYRYALSEELFSESLRKYVKTILQELGVSQSRR